MRINVRNVLTPVGVVRNRRAVQRPDARSNDVKYLPSPKRRLLSSTCVCCQACDPCGLCARTFLE